jgi:hypothetical protein
LRRELRGALVLAWRELARTEALLRRLEARVFRPVAE